MLAMLLLIQAVAGPPVPPELRKPVPRSSKPCPDTPTGDEILVCGRQEDRRLAKLPEPVRRAPEDAMTFRLPGGGTGNVHAIQTTLPGATGSGAAVTLRIPFGKRKK